MQIKEEKTIEINDFFDLVENEGGIYEIETPQGWVEIGDLIRKNNKECFLIRTKDGTELGGSDDHYVETTDGWKKLKDIDVQDCFVKTKNGDQEVVAKESLGIRDTFDLEVKNEEHKYYSNGVVSHNTGKTTIGYIVCHYSPDNTVIWITPEILTENSCRIRNSIKTLYRVADYLSPCAIILEDLDLVGQDRTESRDVMALGTLMNVLDGVNSVDNSITIATTNRLEIIEKALRNRPGRFDRIVEIPAMEAELRKKMFTSRLEKWEQENDIVDYLVENTQGWTPAEIQEFIISANLTYINSGKKKKHMDIETADSIISVMKQFGIGGSSSTFGFGKSKSDN
jgi:hypothetical protein